MRTRVKICGLTRAVDVAQCVRLGADALGFVHHEPSPRHLDVARLADLTARVPPFVTTVLVSVDRTLDELRAIVGRARIDCVQLHGNEDPATYLALGRPLLRAYRLRAGDPLPELSAQALPLFDARVDGVAGGTGRLVPRDLLRDLLRPYVLAGGLEPANVTDALRELAPFAIDLSSGVEREPGIKSHEKLTALIAAVRAFDMTRA